MNSGNVTDVPGVTTSINSVGDLKAQRFGPAAHLIDREIIGCHKLQCF